MCPLKIEFEVPGQSSADIQFINVLGGAIEHFKDVPPAHLRAALNWFSSYAEAKIKEFEDARQNPEPG